MQDSPIGKRLRNQGRKGASLEHGELGYNYRISEMNCALGIEQLKRIDALFCPGGNPLRKVTKKNSQAIPI